MDLFLAHSLILVWTSIGAARRVTTRTTDRLLAAALLAWSNLVVTCLLLSALNRLGQPAWFLGGSTILALLICLGAGRLHPVAEPAYSTDHAGRVHPNPWLVGAFVLTMAPLAYACARVAGTYEPNQPDMVSYHLPRAMYYLGQGSVGNFATFDCRQIDLPFDFNLLQILGLVYGSPLQCINFFNLISWAIAGLAIYRLCRLGGSSPNISLVACGLALISTPVLAEAATSAPNLPTGAALLCALVFALRWHQARLARDALFTGLAAGLAAGSSLNAGFFLPAAAGCLMARVYHQRQHPGPFPGREWIRTWVTPLLLAIGLGATYAAINLAGGAPWVVRVFHLAFDLPFSFADLAANMATGLGQLLWPVSLAADPGEALSRFSFIGLLFFSSAVLVLVSGRTNARSVKFCAWLGLGWALTYLACHRWGPASVGEAIPAFLLLSPCLAAALTDLRSLRPLLRYLGIMLVLGGVLSNGWSAGKFLLGNSQCPFAPILGSSLVPPGLPTLPLLVEFRLKDQPWINVDSDSSNESILPFMVQGHGQRFTSSGRTIPGAYNLISRSSLSRSAAYNSGQQLTTYTLVPIPSKRTSGVEVLASIGSGTTARDYFGITPGAGHTTPIDSNRCILVTLHHGPPGQGRESGVRFKVAGLNPEDHARLAISEKVDDQRTIPLLTFERDGENDAMIDRPFQSLTFRVEDISSYAELGATVIPYLPSAAVATKPIDPQQPTSASSIFVTDVILSRNTNEIHCEGLLPVEGPFPQWNLPYIRWARQPSVRLILPPLAHFSRLVVSFSVQPQLRHAADLEVFFNGHFVQHYRLEERTVWLDQTLELTPRAGENVLEFRDATHATEPDWLDYLERYPDVKAYLLSRQVPLEQGASDHYQTKGKAEGRTVRLRPTDRLEPAPESYYFIYRTLRLEGFRSQ